MRQTLKADLTNSFRAAAPGSCTLARCCRISASTYRETCRHLASRCASAATAASPALLPHTSHGRLHRFILLCALVRSRNDSFLVSFIRSAFLWQHGSSTSKWWELSVVAWPTRPPSRAPAVSCEHRRGAQASAGKDAHTAVLQPEALMDLRVRSSKQAWP